MGLFSSKRKTYVGASISRFFEDSAITSRVKSGITAYLRGNYPASSLSEVILAESKATIDKKARRISRQISGGYEYVYGKFRSNIIVENKYLTDAHILDQLQDSYGSSVDIKYSLFQDPDLSHMSWVKLIDDLGYNPQTNQLSALSASVGATCYLYDGQIKYCTASIGQIDDPAAMETIGLSYDHGATMTRTLDYARVRKTWLEETVLDFDLFEYQYTFRLVKTRTVVKTISTDTVTSDTYTTDGTEPLSYVFLATNLISETPTVIADEETRVFIYHLDYVVQGYFDFLDYEYSGSIDETNALTEADEFNLNPNAEDTSVVTDLTATDYFMVSYTYVSGGNTYYGYYTYAHGSGGDLVLDGIFTVGAADENYFPNIYFRRLGHSMNRDVDKGTDAHRQSKRLCKKMGFDFGDLTETLHNEVGSLDKVKHMHMNFCIPINTMTPVQKKYAYLWFDRIFSLTTHISGTFPASETRTGKHTTYADDYNRQSVFFTGIAKVLVTGVIGEVDTYHSSFNKTADGSGWVGGFAAAFGSNSNHYFQYQITETEYIQYRVKGLRSTQVVQDGHADTARLDESHLLIPLNIGFLNSFTNRERELLMAQSLHIYVYTSETIKVRWYERGIFKVVLVVIGVVIFVVSQGAGTKISAALIAEAFSTAIITQIVVTLTVKLLIKVFNLTALEATILVAAATIATGYYAGGVEVAFSATTIINTLNIAAMALSAGTQIEYKEFLKEQSDFVVSTAEQLRLLEEAKDLLGLDDYIYHPMFSPTSSIELYYDLDDTPDDYYSKLTFSLEIPNLLYSYIESYYDMKLQLPQPKFS